MKTIKAYGAPGCGKSHYLLTKLEDLVDSGVNPEEIVFTSYTNATINAAKLRLSLAKKPRYFRTLHSICYGLLCLTRDQVMNDEAWDDFGRENNYQFSKQDIEDLASQDQKTQADKLRVMYGFSRHAMITSYNELVNRIGFHEVSIGELNAFVATYKAYKHKNNKHDFEDMLELVLKEGFHPDARYLFCDEYQDFSILMDRLVRTWVEKMRPLQVYIAGDDDQVLYSWMAADPSLLNNFPADETIMLTKSYRLAQNVIDLALTVINRNKSRTYKQLESSDKSKHCKIEKYNTLENTLNELPSQGSVYMLARTNLLLQGYIRMLHYRLEPYRRANGKCIWDRDLKVAIYYINEIKRNPNMGFSPFILNQILKFVPSKQADILPHGIKTQVEDTLKKDPNRDYYLSDFDSMGLDKLRYHILNSPPENYLTLKTYKEHISFFVKAAHKNGNRILMQEPRHIVGTVHSIKGGESDHVLLFPGLSRKVINAMDTIEGKEAENRVLYVGLTRSKQSLHVLTPYDYQFSKCGKFYRI